MRLLVRADASSQTGTGHIMRCLALAQACQDEGGEAHFVCAAIPSSLERRLGKEGISSTHINAEAGSIEDMDRTIALINEWEADWAVLDGYIFGTPYQVQIKRNGFRLLCLDDYGHADHYYADIVLNQNSSAIETLYENREPYTRLLLGTKFLMLRREFWRWRDWRRPIPEEARNILVTVGGGDSDNVTLKVMHALIGLDCPKLDIKVVIGHSNPHLGLLQQITSHSSCRMQLFKDINDMAEVMAWADLAISASGVTAWELAFMGLPSLLIVTDQNQAIVAEEQSNRSVALNMGWHAALTETQLASSLKSLMYNIPYRQTLSTNGRVLIGGHGCANIIKILAELE